MKKSFDVAHKELSINVGGIQYNMFGEVGAFSGSVKSLHTV